MDKKRTTHKRAASTYEGYSQNQYYYNTKRTVETILSRKFHRATCT
nr:MAG TPA: hypothetical protein [Caudoviricetes sp.]